MKTLKTLMAGALLLLVLAGCEALQILTETEPLISDVTGPTGSISDLDYKGTTATANVKIFSGAEILLRRASSEAALRSMNAVDLDVSCTGDGAIKSCSGLVAETPFDTGDPVLGSSGRVFYQWFVEYGDSGGVAEGPVRSFTLVEAPTCTLAAADAGGGLGAGGCAANQACSNVILHMVGIPGSQTNAARCHIPAP